MIADFADRRFQLWEYQVSHGSLLIRSPKSVEARQNIDLVFVGVEYLAVPRFLNGVVVERGGEEDQTAVSAAVGEIDPQHLFVLRSAGRRHHVVAVGCHVDSNDGDLFDSPF